jgi:hypothetical protein
VLDDPVTGLPELTFGAKKAVDKIFEEFSECSSGNIKCMTLQKCIEFIKKCTGEMSSEHDPRLLHFLRKFGANEGTCVYLEGLQRFFIDSCVVGAED